MDQPVCFLDGNQAGDWLLRNGWETRGRCPAYRGDARQVRISVPCQYSRVAYLVEVLFSLWRERGFPGALLLLAEYDMSNSESLTHFIWEAICRGRDPRAPSLAYWAEYLVPQEGGTIGRKVGEKQQEVQYPHQLFTAREAGFAKAFFLLAVLGWWRAYLVPPGGEFFFFCKGEDIFLVSQLPEVASKLCGWLREGDIAFKEAATARPWFTIE